MGYIMQIKIERLVYEYLYRMAMYVEAMRIYHPV